jgi:SAM-dependent methyltransferase
MSGQTLKSRSEIDLARADLVRRGLSIAKENSGWSQLMNRLGLIKTVKVGDLLKSWDVLKTTTFIEEHVSKELPILDLGAYASEILCILHRLGYSALTGVDLNADVRLMPYANVIQYQVANFMETPFVDESFKAITAISVIEHGFKSQALLKEVSRLLRPGGYFIASVDYWPEKVDTTGIQFFGLDWKIFSEQEVLDFVREAQQFNMTPDGSLDLSACEKPIACADRNYTFAWLVLKKGAIAPR